MDDETINTIEQVVNTSITNGALNPIFQIGDTELVLMSKAVDMLTRIVSVGYGLRLWADQLRLNGDLRSVAYAAEMERLATALETGELPDGDSDQQD